MLSKEETLALAAETLDDLELRDKLRVDDVGWPGAAGVLWVRLVESETEEPITFFVPWELADETADGFKRKLKKAITRVSEVN